MRKIVSIPSRIIGLLETVKNSIKAEFFLEQDNVEKLFNELLVSYSKLDKDFCEKLENPSLKHRNIRDLRQGIKQYFEKTHVLISKILDKIQIYFFERKYDRNMVIQNIDILKKELRNQITCNADKVEVVLINHLENFFKNEAKAKQQQLNFEQIVLNGFSTPSLNKKKSTPPLAIINKQKNFETLILGALSNNTDKQSIKITTDACIKIENDTKTVLFENQILNGLSDTLCLKREAITKKSNETFEKEKKKKTEMFDFSKNVLEHRLEFLKGNTRKIEDKKNDSDAKLKKKQDALQYIEELVLKHLLDFYGDNRIEDKLKTLEERYQDKYKKIENLIKESGEKKTDLDSTNKRISEDLRATEENIGVLVGSIRIETTSLRGKQAKLVKNEKELRETFIRFFNEKKALKREITIKLGSASKKIEVYKNKYADEYQKSLAKINSIPHQGNRQIQNLNSPENVNKKVDQVLKDFKTLADDLLVKLNQLE